MICNRTLAATGLAIALTACNQPKSEEKSETPTLPSKGSTVASESGGTTLVTIGDERITVEEFQNKLMKQSPFLRARYTTAEKKLEFLESMIKFDLLAREARRRGLDEDPDVQDTMKKVMVQKLMRQRDQDAGQPIATEILQKYYQDHIDDYDKPERIRSSHIFLAAAKDDLAARNLQKKKAKALRKQLIARKADPLAFQNLAKEASEDAASKARSGDLNYQAIEDLTSAWGEPFATAVFAMPNVGDISEIIETDKGFHIAKLSGRQKAFNRTFEQVQKQIEGRVRREQRSEQFENFVAELREKDKVEINESLLEKVEVAATGVTLPGGKAVAPPRPGTEDAARQ